MRPLSAAALLVSVAGFCLALSAGQKQPARPSPIPAHYSFRGNVFPILQSKCQPCHFPEGKMYKKLPFDDSVTVAKLGLRLNTRLKERADQEVITGWSPPVVKK